VKGAPAAAKKAGAEPAVSKPPPKDGAQAAVAKEAPKAKDPPGAAKDAPKDLPDPKKLLEEGKQNLSKIDKLIDEQKNATPPLDPPERRRRERTPVDPAAQAKEKDRTAAIDAFQAGKSNPDDLLKAFGGRDELGKFVGSDAFLELTPDQQKAVVRGMYQGDLADYNFSKDVRRAIQVEDASALRKLAGDRRVDAQQRSVYQAQADLFDARRGLQSKGSAGALDGYDKLTQAGKADGLEDGTRKKIADLRAGLRDQITGAVPRELEGGKADAALKRTAEIADRLGLSPAERSTMVHETARRMAEKGANDEAIALRKDDALRRIDEETAKNKYNPVQRAIRGIDFAAGELEAGQGLAAAGVLDSEAKKARDTLKGMDPNSPEGRILTSFAENAEARAHSYRQTVPNPAFQAAGDLMKAARGADDRAAALERAGKTNEAKLLRAIAADSRVQASLAAEGAAQSNSLLGQGIAQTYRQIVDASFDKKIEDTGTLFGLRTGPKDQLIADKDKMKVVFDELNRTMRENGVSLDRAWNMMFDDSRIDGWRADKRVPGFPTRHDAAAFLRDHEVTKNLLIPFSDMARGFADGKGDVIDKARGDLVGELRKHGQWEIARGVLDGYMKAPKSDEGRAAFDKLNDNERSQWWKQKAGEFIEKELPVLVLSGLVSGGAGWGAGALAKAAQWGPRAIKAVTIGTELGTFVPAERILNDAINGKAPDWSAGGLARDYALTLGGYGLFKGMGKAWSYFRAGKNVAPGVGNTLDDAVRIGTGPGPAAQLGKEVPLAEALIQKLPGWQARPNDAFGRLMADATTGLEAKIASGEIKTFQQALDYMGKEVQAVSRAMNRGDLAGSQTIDVFGKLRKVDPRNPNAGGLMTPIDTAAYRGYLPQAQDFVGAGGIRTMTQDGINLTSTMAFPQGQKWWFHTSPEVFPQIMQKMEAAWQRGLAAKSSDDVVKAAAELHWWGAHLTPFERGSAGAMDAMTKALLRRGGVKPGAWREGVGVDLEAFHTPLAEFVRKYPSFFAP
jgi:hypothetical protein